MINIVDDEIKEALKISGWVTACAAIVAALLLAVGCDKLRKLPEDSPLEEFGEAVAERYLEDKFGLPKGSMKGKIDVSYNSPEEGND